ncbi:hypothetical protein Cgig2_020784 [Carnegiea gigantea]|uniref:Protein FAR1-RELATED SEQUENCE n=1 Tax=Carnegiea gigantea TaxID=171969 RepID=A0A9Q1GJE6_9CARY|nr:hypothetical protein Cgig2_020784 [Carnegiea gigantea]
MYCHVQGITNVEGDRTYEIKHNYENKTRINYVVYNEPTSECQCSWHFFDSDGIPCAHMLLVFTSDSLREILAAYSINRWTKMAANALMYELDSVVRDACGEIAAKNKLIATSQARDNPKGGKLRRKHAEIKEGCQAHILLRSTDDGKWTKMAANALMYEFDSVVRYACGEIAVKNKLIATSQARDNPKGGKLRRKHAEIKEGCQAHILLRSTDDGKWTKMAANALMYEFDSVVRYACGEIAVKNKLIGDVWSQFYKCMDLAGHTPAKLQLLLSSMISIEH